METWLIVMKNFMCPADHGIHLIIGKSKPHELKFLNLLECRELEVILVSALTKCLYSLQ